MHNARLMIVVKDPIRRVVYADDIYFPLGGAGTRIETKQQIAWP